MLEQLKKKVCAANKSLPNYDLVKFTWGNVSEISSDRKYVVIKPSGVSYKTMKPSDMVVVDMKGKVVGGKLKPSSDVMTHIEIYKNFKNVKGVCHTHSTFATSWAQAHKDIPALGTTHADNFNGDIPCTGKMSKKEIKNNYELNTGKVIVKELRKRKLKPEEMPGVIVNSHGPFTWGNSAKDAVENSVVLEEVAKMAFISKIIEPKYLSLKIDKVLLNKHFYRKHGKNATYGQK